MSNKECHQTKCPHSFQFLNIPQLDWSPKNQRFYAGQITRLGQYGLKTLLTTKERSPDPDNVILTFNGVLQVCVILSPPFKTKKQEYIRTFRYKDPEEDYLRRCDDRQVIIEDIAKALLNYERGCSRMMQAFDTIKQDATVGLQSLGTALKLLNALRKRKLMPKQDKRLPTQRH